jgi:hypothetical protein
MARRPSLPRPNVSLIERAKAFDASRGTNTRTPIQRPEKSYPDLETISDPALNYNIS